jgi:amino acid transporter
MRIRKTLSIMWLLVAVLASVGVPILIGAYYEKEHSDLRTRRLSEARDRVWVHGCGVDKIIPPLPISEIESAIGGFPQKTTRIALRGQDHFTVMVYGPDELRLGGEFGHLPPGSEVEIQHISEGTGLMWFGVLVAVISWLLFVFLGFIGALRAAEGWCWRSRLVKISVYSSIVYALLAAVGIIIVYN